MRVAKAPIKATPSAVIAAADRPEEASSTFIVHSPRPEAPRDGAVHAGGGGPVGRLPPVRPFVDTACTPGRIGLVPSARTQAASYGRTDNPHCRAGRHARGCGLHGSQPAEAMPGIRSVRQPGQGNLTSRPSCSMAGDREDLLICLPALLLGLSAGINQRVYIQQDRPVGHYCTQVAHVVLYNLTHRCCCHVPASAG
jgi:hypothetical protein